MSRIAEETGLNRELIINYFENNPDKMEEFRSCMIIYRLRTFYEKYKDQIDFLIQKIKDKLYPT